MTGQEKMTDDDALVFADEREDAPGPGSEAPAGVAPPPWKILVIDDEEDTIVSTRLVLGGFTFQGRGLDLISGGSGQDAQRLIAEHPDAAVMLLDVVMETETAGLDVVRYVRERAGNHMVRIILRTGQPGNAPEQEVLADYDINDYRNKATLDAKKLVSSITTALRTYRDMEALDRTRRELLAATDALRRSEESLNRAQAIAHVGNWDWDIPDNLFFWSDETYRIFGLDPQAVPPSRKVLTDAILPGDRHKVERILDRALAPDADREPYRVEYRIRRPDGEERCLLGRGEVELDGEGRPRRMVCTVRDITEQRYVEDRNHRALQSRIAISALLETGIEPLSMTRQLEVALDIILTVPWLAILNKGSIFLFDSKKQELTLEAHRNLADHLLKTCDRTPLGRCLCGKAALKREIIFARHLDDDHDVAYDGIADHGHYCVPILSRRRLLGVLNLYLPPGHAYDPEEEAFMSTISFTLAGVIERREMEARLQKAEERMTELAHHDHLTGLPNRLLFVEVMKQNLAHAKRDKRLLAVMFMDLDKFKEVNDKHGHDVGDLLLQEAAKRIQSCLREGDTVARLGGDEFTIILPDVSSLDRVKEIAARVIKKLGKRFNCNGTECRVGVSIGVSVFPEHGKKPDILLRRADQAMYAVKREGRNAFLFFSDDYEDNRS